MALDNDNSPATVAPIITAQLDAMQKVRDLYDGGACIRSKASEYVPQNPAETALAYAARRKRLYPFLAVERTVAGLSGMIHRKDVVLGDDVPASIAGDRNKRNKGGYWENIDLAGTHGDVFARERCDDALVDGHAAIFVDFPDLGGKKPTRGEEQAMKVRGYFVPIRKGQIVNVDTTVIDGRVVLTQLVLLFVRWEKKGRFGKQKVEEYRVYDRDEAGKVTFEVWRKTEGDAEPKMATTGTIANQVEIPLAVMYGPRKIAPFVSKPPLEDLAERNIVHMQVESDELTSLHMAGTPHPVLAGEMNDDDAGSEAKTGPNWLTKITKESTLTYLEHSGSALGAMKDKLSELKGEIATLGLAMLQRETRAAETAEGKRIDKSGSDSALAVMARNEQDALEQALGFLARYQGEKQGGSVKVNRDFEHAPMTADEARALSDAVAAGTLSLDTMWKMQVERGYLPEDFDPEEERRQIAKDALTLRPEPEPDAPDDAAENDQAA